MCGSATWCRSSASTSATWSGSRPRRWTYRGRSSACRSCLEASAASAHRRRKRRPRRPGPSNWPARRGCRWRTGRATSSSLPTRIAEPQTDSRRVVEWSAVVRGRRRDEFQRLAGGCAERARRRHVADDARRSGRLRPPRACGNGPRDRRRRGSHPHRRTLGELNPRLARCRRDVARGRRRGRSCAVGRGRRDRCAGEGGEVAQRSRRYRPNEGLSAGRRLGLVSASVGIGETLIEGFPGMTQSERGFLWTSSTNAVLGTGVAECSLSVGIGQIEVRPTALCGKGFYTAGIGDVASRIGPGSALRRLPRSGRLL